MGRDNAALRSYLLRLALRILDKATEPIPLGLSLGDILKANYMKLGLIQAVEMIRHESAEMKCMS
jgi:hypothetical protein